MRVTEDHILEIIWSDSELSTIQIHERASAYARTPTSWFDNLFGWLPFFCRSIEFPWLWATLDRLYDKGLIDLRYGKEPLPERGMRPQVYWSITPKGVQYARDYTD
jgi:hypothetical protein